jgi:2-aminoadipate transaminase
MTTTRPSLDSLFAERARVAVPPLYGAAGAAASSLISLSYGLADPALFPREELAAATAEVLADDAAAALNYGMAYSGLSEQICARLRAQGVAAEPEQLLISYGSGQILALLPEILIDQGDSVVIEGPSFMGAVKRFGMAGAKLLTVPVDAEGMDVDALEELLRGMAARGERPKFIYTIPTFHNPSGATMTLDRRRRLVELAATYGVLVVEDDAYGDLRFHSEPLPPLAALDSEGWVLRVSTFSKILAPGVRVGWAHGRREVIDRLAMFKLEGSTGPFLTRLVARFSAEGRLESHIAALREHYRMKCDVMLAAIRREMPELQMVAPAGGFFVWGRLPQGLSATALLERSQAHGAAFLPGTACYANGQGDDELRLAFSFHSAEKIERAVAGIGKAMRELRTQN